MKNVLVIVTLASCVTALCRAASAAPVPENLLACRKLQDESQRVRCYDAEIAKMSGAATSGTATSGTATSATKPPGAASARSAPSDSAPAVPVAGKAPAPSTTPAAAAGSAGAAPGAAASKQSSTANFGEEMLPSTARAGTPKEDMALLSNITGLHAVAPKTYTIALANGQVWRQEGPAEVALFFRVGDQARIEKATLGSYHLSTVSTGAKNWVRVTRIQ